MQGTGIGNLLMACVHAEHLQAAEHAGSKFLVVEAHKPLVRYYQKLGFIPASGERGDLTTLYKSTSAIESEMSRLLG